MRWDFAFYIECEGKAMKGKWHIPLCDAFRQELFRRLSVDEAAFFQTQRLYIETASFFSASEDRKAHGQMYIGSAIPVCEW